MFWSLRRAALVSLAGAVLFACGQEPPAPPAPVDLFNQDEMGSYEFDGEPKLVVSAGLDFGDGAVGEPMEAVVSLRNEGRARLHIDRLEVEEPFSLVGFAADDEPIVILPGGEQEVWLEVVLDEAGEVLGELLIESDDPSSPELRVNLSARGHDPCLDVDESALSFGEVARGEPRQRAVRVGNCSVAAELVVELSDVASPEFDARWLNYEDSEVLIAPGEQALLGVDFSSSETGVYQGVLKIESDDPDRPSAQLQLTAEVVPAECPVAVISARVEPGSSVGTLDSSIFNAEPLDEVTLDAFGSHHGEGFEITEVEWTLLSVPTDSSALLTEESSSEVNGLFLDIAGIYEVGLRVWSADGVASCESAVLTIYAVSGSDLHVQLVWDTPGDPSRHNGHGADMDLHFLHPLGEWGQGPYDCFWQNRTPVWGDADGEAGNPRMDIDQTQGWGPENIDMNQPEPGISYRIGVHYFTDRGYGPSRATVRVFLYGDLVAELVSPWMYVGQFWEAATIEWPEETVTSDDQLFDGMP